MDESKNYNLLLTDLLSPEEFNFILLEASNDIHSPNLKDSVRAEAMNILKKDATGTLLLPFMNTD
ncbi:MAG: hypothetical protein ABSE95_13175 [Thermodesulfobacteriota bacterium]|jgi:hypothetical protein